MDTAIIAGIFTLLGIILKGAWDKRSRREEKHDEKKEEANREQIISDRMFAERMLVYAREIENLERNLQKESQAKDVRIVKLEMHLKLANEELKKVGGKQFNVE